MLSETTVHVAIELSSSSWLVAIRLPGTEKSRVRRIEGGDATGRNSRYGGVAQPSLVLQ